MTNIITIDELKNSVLNANIDDEYIQPAITEAQTIYLREILGDALLNAIVNKINGNTLTDKYLTLVNEYIKPYLSYMVQSIIVVPITYKIRNAGVIQQYDNGFTSTQMKDTQYLKDYYDGKAEFYGNRLTEYLKKNASDIVEYRLSASNVTNPTTTQNVTNIFLGGTKRGKCGGNIPSGGTQHDTVEWDDIINRPNFASVATSGNYNDLNHLPDLFSGDYNDLTNKPDLFSGDYNDLTNKPDLTEYVRKGDYEVDKQAIDNALADKVETGNLCTINGERLDTRGDFELVRTDSIATLTITQGGVEKGTFTPNGNDVTIALDAGGGGGGSTDWSDITNKPNFATVATSGDYEDLDNKPSIPTVPTNVSAFTNDAGYTTFDGDYNSLTNKPTIPTVNNAILTIKQGGVSKGTFTANAGTDVEINLDAGGGGGSTDWSDITNKPNFATVATSGDYEDLDNKPSIPTVPTNVSAFTNDAGYTTFDGDYNSLTNKPTIPVVPSYTTETLIFTLQGGTTRSIEFYTVPNYFYVEDISGSDNTLSITSNSSAPAIEVFKSTDRATWTSMGTTAYGTPLTATIPANGKLYLKATTNAWASGEWAVNVITASGNHNVGGNSMSLLYGDNFDGQTTFPNNSDYALEKLFNGDTKLINASKLLLPSLTLTAYCYLSMFEGCTNMTTAPALLPATNVPVVAYFKMFNGCTNLTTPPVIDATVLSGNNACQQMFYNCKGLTTAPTIKVKELKTYNNLCKEMFRGCTNLNSVSVYFDDISGYDCLANWLNGVSVSGDFYALGTAQLPSGASGIPSGWTTHTSL